MVVGVLGGFVYCSSKWTNPFALAPKTLLFLVLSALAAGTSYFRALKVAEASKVALVDK